MKMKLLLASAALLAAQMTQATPFQLTATLTGDPRTANPDNLIVDVTVVGNTTSNQVNWTIDINSPAHPKIKMDEFAFNMNLAAGVLSFSNFNPAGWAISTPSTLQGSGNMQFLFEATDPPGPPKAPDITNTQNLTFTMTKSSGNFAINDFLLAGQSCSNDQTLGCGQMGAHLQSLTAGKGESDSGIALGDWKEPDDPGETPEPATLALLGFGLTGLALRRRKTQ